MGSGSSASKRERRDRKESELQHVTSQTNTPRHKNKFTEPTTATTDGEASGHVIQEKRTNEEVSGRPKHEPITISNADEHSNEGTSDELTIIRENVATNIKRMESSVGKESCVTSNERPSSQHKQGENREEEAAEKYVTLNGKPETEEPNEETFTNQNSERLETGPSDDQEEKASCQIDTREENTYTIKSNSDSKSRKIRSELRQPTLSGAEALIDTSEATVVNDQTLKATAKIANRTGGPVPDQCSNLITDEPNQPLQEDSQGKTLTHESNAISNNGGDEIITEDGTPTNNENGNKNGITNMEKSVDGETLSGTKEQIHVLNHTPEATGANAEKNNIPHETNQTEASYDVSKEDRKYDDASKSTLTHTEFNSHLSANLEFYQNKIKSRPPPGHTIEEMLKWFGDFDKLERNHSYIQWLFPIPDSSGMNVHAQSLQPHEAQAIRDDKIAYGRVLKAFEMMLNFYGMKLDESARKVTRDPHIWKGRFQHLNKSSHNYLRITRILRSIGSLGYARLQYPWLQFILRESRSMNTLLSNLQGGCQKFWIESLNDDGERGKAIEIITMSEAEFEQAKFGEEDSDKREADKERGSNRNAQDRVHDDGDKANSKDSSTQIDENGVTDRVDTDAEAETEDTIGSTRSNINKRDSEKSAGQSHDRQQSNSANGKPPSLNF